MAILPLLEKGKKMKRYEAINAVIKEMRALCPEVEVRETFYSPAWGGETQYSIYHNGHRINDLIIYVDLENKLSSVSVEVLRVAIALRKNILPPFHHDLKFKSIYGKEYFYLNGKRISNNLGNALLNCSDLKISVIGREGVPNTSAIHGITCKIEGV